jgi:hypothetical protein
MPYPSRGHWQFKNVRRGFDFWPPLDSIQITQSYPDMVATFSCEVIASDAFPEYEFEAEDEVRVIFDGGRIFAGHLKSVAETGVSEFGPRKWQLEAQDYTAKLGDAIIRTRQHRKKERAQRRVRWILSFLDNAWHLDGRHLDDIPDEQVERQDMYGMTIAEALDSVSNEVGLHYWIDLDNTFHMHKSTTHAAPFDLDNEAPDYVNSFPFREFTYRKDSTDLHNAILTEPEKRSESRWAVSHENIDLYDYGDATGRNELFVSAEEIRTARGAARHGDVMLQRTKFHDLEVMLTVHEPGVYAGMWVTIHEALWDRDQNLRVVEVSITALDPHDSESKAYLKSALTLTRKPKRRKPKLGRPEERTSNVAKYSVDGFDDRTVTPASPEPGDAFSPTLTHWRLDWSMVGSWSSHVFTPGTPTTPTFGPTTGPPVGGEIRDQLAYQHTTYPYVPCEPFGRGASTGWREYEYWVAFTVPTKPVDVAGMFITVTVLEKHDSAVTGGVVTRASLTAPTAVRSAVVYGTEGTVFLPASVIPDAGETMYIGVTPGWTAQHDYGYYCVSSPTPAAYTGGWASQISVSGFTWATADDDIDLGTSAAPAGAPWQGGGSWEVTGLEGAPTFGIGDGALYLTAEEPAGVGIALVGQGEDADLPTQPFDGPFGIEVEFEVDTLGDVGAAGTRSIELTTTGEGSRTVGTVHLGDMANPTSLTVAGPTSTANEPVTLTANERYRASFDTRSGELVAKIWRVADGEPAGIVVLGPIDETEDMGDRLVLWLRGGNGVGDEQTIRITDIDAAVVASPGSSIAFEWIGYASGDTDRFRTRHRHLMGTLIAHVNGIDAHPTVEDGIEFRLDAFPTQDSGIHASYIVAEEDQFEIEEEEEEGS